MPRMRFDTNDVWQICRDQEIGEGVDGRIRYGGVKGRFLYLEDSSPAATARQRAFVLFSPSLTNRTIASLLTVRKRNRVPSGFSVVDAGRYTDIYVVGDFPQEELDLLLDPAIIDANVVQITGTRKQMREQLESLLSPS